MIEALGGACGTIFPFFRRRRPRRVIERVIFPSGSSLKSNCSMSIAKSAMKLSGKREEASGSKVAETFRTETRICASDFGSDGKGDSRNGAKSANTEFWRDMSAFCANTRISSFAISFADFVHSYRHFNLSRAICEDEGGPQYELNLKVNLPRSYSNFRKR